MNGQTMEKKLTKSTKTTTEEIKLKRLVSMAINEKIDFSDPEIASQKVVDALQSIGEHLIDRIVTDALNAIMAEYAKEPYEKGSYEDGHESGLHHAHGAVFRRFYFGLDT
jgi:hypothetical protein